LKNPRNPIFKALGAWLIDILITNDKYDEVIEDSGYDVSTRSRKSTESFDISEYDTVGDFLNNEVGPRTIATYCSGHGLAAQSRAWEAEELCGEVLRSWIKSSWPQFVENGYIDEDLMEELCEQLVDCEFTRKFSEKNLAEMVSAYLPDAIEAREACKREEEALRSAASARRQKVLVLGAEMADRIAAATKGRRFEKSNFGELLKTLIGFAEEMPEGRDKVAAALEIKPWPFQASNSVAVELQNIFRLK
jgi:hypothetical protein